MSVYLESVPAYHLLTLLEALTRQGHSYSKSLNALKLSQSAMALPGARIPRPLFGAAIAALMDETGRRDLGFEMGRHTNLTAYPVIGQLLRSSRTLGEGMQRVAPYVPLVTPTFQMQCEYVKDALVVRWRPLRPMPYDMMTVALECVLVASQSANRQLFPAKVVPMSAKVSWRPPPHAERYKELAGLSMEYLADTTEPGITLSIPKQAADQVMPPVQSHVWQSAQDACRHELAHIQSMQGWSDWVTHVLDNVEDCQPTQTELASLMGISGRTLARHIEAEGRSFKALVSERRERKAKQLLVESDISVSELARLLGYTDTANFTRAFKMSSGIAPSEFRRRMRPTT